MVLIMSFLAGLVFALGLGISGMSNPNKVLGFLDLVGAWDPDLLWVMAGAVSTYAVGFRFVTKRAAPLLSEQFHLPHRSGLDSRLFLGAIVFGA